MLQQAPEIFAAVNERQTTPTPVCRQVSGSFGAESVKENQPNVCRSRSETERWGEVDRVINADNDFEVLALPMAICQDFALMKRHFLRVSLSTHPDKTSHPQADAAFRKAYGAFETLSDVTRQRWLLWVAGIRSIDDLRITEEDRKRFEEEDDGTDGGYEWWWQASIPEMTKAAEEADGANLDLKAVSVVSDGVGADVTDVRWIALSKARELHRKDIAIFIDCREEVDYAEGAIPGAWNVPMHLVSEYGLVQVLGPERIHQLLVKRRQQLIIIYSSAATPFSRCRAFCRWLLRAGHQTLPVARIRRLHGGLHGWTQQGGLLNARARLAAI